MFMSRTGITALLGTCAGKGGVNPGVTSGFRAAFTATINMAVNQGLSPLARGETSSGLNAAANRAETGELSVAVNQDVNAFLSLAVNRAASRVASSGPTYTFNRKLTAAVSSASNAEPIAELRIASNPAVPVRVPWPATAPVRNPREYVKIQARVPALVQHPVGRATVLLPCFEAHAAIYMW
jgi:hypothetical protein